MKALMKFLENQLFICSICHCMLKSRGVEAGEAEVIVHTECTSCKIKWKYTIKIEEEHE